MDDQFVWLNTDYNFYKDALLFAKVHVQSTHLSIKKCMTLPDFTDLFMENYICCSKQQWWGIVSFVGLFRFNCYRFFT